jgi:aryl-alcohol dehydrogenase-like predicted oxidoreductase
MRIAKPIVRAGLSMFPALRRHIVKRRPSVQSQPITGPLIESSIAESLRRLRTDYVDVLAVHNPDKFDLSRHDVCMALDNVIRRGYARRVGIAGDRIAVDARTIAALKITVLQFADGPFNSSIRSLGVLATSQTMGFVTHSVFGHDGCLDILLGLLATDRRLSAALDDLGYRGEARSRAAAFLLDYALGNNPDGVVLLSMYDKQHRTFNLSPDRGRVAITVLRSLISQHMIPSAGPAKAEAWN